MKATTTQTTKVRLTSAAGRVVLATCAVGLALAAWAPAALAHGHEKTSKTQNTRSAFIATMDSPCTFETVDIEGHQHLQTKTQQNGNRTKYTFKEHQSGKGLGRPLPQRKYEYQHMSENTSVDSTTGTFYIKITSKEHLVRQGERPLRADDFYAKSRLHIKMKNGQAEPTVESFDSDKCK